MQKKEDELLDAQIALEAKDKELESLRAQLAEKNGIEVLPKGDFLKQISVIDAWNILKTIEHKSGSHLDNVYLCENGEHHWHPGAVWKKNIPLDPKKDIAKIRRGEKTRSIIMPGRYISESKVIAMFPREEILELKKEITGNYDNYIRDEDKKVGEELAKRPNLTSRKIAQAIENIK
jgi:hypothetical protein